MEKIRTHEGKLLLFSRNNNPNAPQNESFYDGTGSFLGSSSNGKTTRDSRGTVVAIGRAPALLLRPGGK
jgi:hypothetical protein